MKSKKLFLFGGFLFFVTLAIVTTAVFAYYKELHQGWGQQIKSTTIIFSLNGKNINDITNYSLELLNKGDEADLNFDVLITSRSAQFGIGEFNIDFNFENTMSDGNATDNELARAIEVYKFENGYYQYECMLNELENITGLIPVSHTGSTDTTRFCYKLVYGKAAGTYYQNKSFAIKLDATSRIIQQTDERVYISSYTQLLQFIQDSNNTGKTMVLNRDIEIPAEILNETNNKVVIPNRIGLDFNGNTLTLSNNGILEFNYTNSTYTTKPIGLSNNVNTLGGFVGGGININTLNDAMFIQNNMTNILSSITMQNYSYSQLVSNIQYNANELSSKIYANNDLIKLISGYQYYFSNNLTQENRSSFSLDSNGTNVLSYIDGEYYINQNYNNIGTKIQNFNANVNLNSQSNLIDINLKIRGTSGNAIAQYYLDTIPSSVDGSIFLPEVDSYTDATLTWISQDKNLLSSNGQYLLNGFEDYASWNDKTMTLGVIINMNGSQYYAEKNINVILANAKERTEKVYSYDQIILDSQNQIFNLGAMFDTLFALKSNIKDVNISIVDGNLSNSGYNYIQLLEVANDYDSIKLINQPQAGVSSKINTILTIIYNNNGTDISYQMPVTIVVVGNSATSEINDIQNELQLLYNDNDYINGESFEFEVKASTKENGTFIDYFTTTNCENYIYIQNGIWKQDNQGNFVKLNNEYKFFRNKYELVDGDYQISSTGNYVNINNSYLNLTELINNGNVYSRNAKITLLPNLIPSKRETLALIQAKLWNTLDAFNNPIFLSGTNGQQLVYNITLIVEGIYHNNEQEIADFSLFNELLNYFDGLGSNSSNGYIEVSEAESAWQTLINSGKVETSVSYNVTYYPLNFQSKKIKSLKGIEYFINIQDINFADNKIPDLSYISNLYDLKYINFNNNNISDLEPLTYLDKLEVIRINNKNGTVNGNKISDLEPLRYLPNVAVLDVSYNNLISDFSPLLNYKKVKNIVVKQTNNLHTYTNYVNYIFTLILANNSGAYLDVLNAKWQSTNEQIVAARALSELVGIQEAYNVLFVPNTYFYEGKTYILMWDVGNTDDLNYLSFDTNSNNQTVGYTIVSPVVDRKIDLSVTVTSDGTNTYRMSNQFTLTLKKDQVSSANSYIQLEDGSYLSAENAIPDANLRSLLFQYFNTVNDTNVIVSDKTNLNTITYSEISNNSRLILDFSNKGITNLFGLRYFKDGINDTNSILLNGNIFENSDISELSFLSNLGSLKIDGQLFDFNQLMPNQDLGSDGLLNLLSLSVYGSYGLSNEDVLSGLYNIYLTNDAISIYKDDNSTIWNPYIEKLVEFSQSLPNALNFVNPGDTYEFYQDTQNLYYELDIYGTILKVYLTNGTFIGSNTSSFNALTQQTTYQAFNQQQNIEILDEIQYTSMTGVSDVLYMSFNLVANDGLKDISYVSYIELITDFNANILLTDYSQNQTNVSITEIFKGRSIRKQVSTWLSDLINNTQSVDSLENIGSGYYYSNGYYYITKATLLALNTDDSFVLTIDGITYDDEIAIKGLELLNIKNINIIRDGDLGDGSNLVNLTSIMVENSTIDLTRINRNLPNIKSLIFGAQPNEKSNNGYKYNKFVLLYKENYYALSRFTNLETLHILNCNIYDWEGLRGLIGIDLLNLKIYASTLSYTNKNNNTEETETIIKSIYEYYPDSEKHYFIGSFLFDYDVVTEYDATWNLEVEGVTSLNTAILNEYNEFASSIIDFGVKYNNELAFLTADTMLENNDTIFLPKQTSTSMYKNLYDSSSNYVKNNFAIRWYVYGVDTSSVLSSLLTNAPNFSSSGQTTTKNLKKRYFETTSDITMTVNNTTTYDYYLIIEGVIGYGYYDNNGDYQSLSGVTKYSYLYPVLIKGANESTATTTSLGVFLDTNVRLLTYLGFCNTNYISNGAIDNTNLSKITSIKINGTANTYNFNGTVLTLTNFGFQKNQNICKPILSLAGYNNVFTGLKTLYVENTDVMDISGIANITTLEDLRLRASVVANCGAIKDVSAISTLTNLKICYLNFNNIKTIIHNNASIFNASASTLTNIDISGNMWLNSDSLWAMANDTNTYNALTNLYCNNSNMCYEFECYKALQKLLGKRTTSQTINAFRLNVAASYSLTKVEIDAFINTCSEGGAIYNEYLTTIQNNKTFTAIGNYVPELKNSTWFKNNKNLGSSSSVNSVKGVVVVSYRVGNTNKMNAEFRNVTIISANASEVTLKIGENNYNSSYFDPTLWAYLTNNKTADSLTGEIKYTEIETLNFGENSSLNIESLKGVDLLPGLKNIVIRKGENFKLSSLWEAGTTQNPKICASLEKIEIMSRAMTEEAFAVIKHAPNLKTIRVDNIFRSLDLLKTFTFDNETTCLAKIIANHSNLTTIIMNMNNNFDYFVANTQDKGIQSALNTIYNNPNKTFFGYAQTNTETQYTLTYRTCVSGQQYFDSFTYAQNTYNKYINSSTFNDIIKVELNSNSNSYTVTPISEVNDIKYENLLKFKTDEINREILPETLNQSDLTSASGVTFYLPSSTTFGSSNMEVTYTCISHINDTNTDFTSNYISQSGVFSINVDNYVEANTITISANLGALGSYSHKFTILNYEFVDPVSSTMKKFPYYVETSQGVYEDAFDVFGSGDMVYYLFNEYFTTKSLVVNSSTISNFPQNLSRGQVLTQNALTSIKTLDIQLTETDKKVEKTSIKGFEYFVNLQEFYYRRGYLTSIESLRNLNLVTFSYTVSTIANEYVSLILDFSPLLNSKNSLKNFVYGFSNDFTLEDFSFLTNFDQLENIVFYTSPTLLKDDSYIRNLETTTFKFMLSYFELNQPNTNVYYYTPLADDMDQGKKLKSTSEFLKAVDEFSYLNFSSSDVTLFCANILNIDSSQSTLNGKNVNLPSVINHGGLFYAIDYKSISNFAKVNDIKLNGIVGKTYNFTHINENNVEETISVMSGSVISYENLRKICSSREFMELSISNEISVYTSVFVSSNNNLNERYGMRINARIFINDVAFDKTFFLVDN